MVPVAVDDFSALRVLRDDHEGNPRTVAEEVDRLKEPRIPVTAALIESDEDRGVLEELLVALDLVDHAVDQGLENVELGARGVTVVEAVGLEVGDGREVSVLEIVEKVDGVLDVGLPLRRVAHDRGRVLKRVADVAVPVAAGSDENIEGIRGTVVESNRGVVAAAIERPVDVLLVESVADRPQ